MYQIDQSGKIEDTAKITVLAAKNKESYTVIITTKDKRRLQEWFRLCGATTIFIDAVFSVSIFLLIKQLNKHQKHITVDIEYLGHTKAIEDMIQNLDNDIHITWTLIGKNSPAHDLAYKTYRGKIKAKRKISAREIWKLAKIASKFLAKKTAGGRLKIGLSPTNRRSAPASKQRITRKKGFVKIKK